MDHSVPNSARRNTNGFQKLIDGFFKQSGLPFAEVINATKIEEVFRKHGGLVDGFTFTMPDTPKNQREYPQAKTQKPGIGLPIARCVAVISLATACVLDLAIGPYAGKNRRNGSLASADERVFARGHRRIRSILLHIYGDRGHALVRYGRLLS